MADDVGVGFEPIPFQVINDPAQLKAFTDPLRIRVLNVLKDRAATNQQIAAALEAPQARVLYHVRVLVDCGLIRLVEQRVRGGNVEKYYRSVARMFSLRYGPSEVGPYAASVLQATTEGVATAELRWPEEAIEFETRRVAMTPERREAFRQRLDALITEYWGGPGEGPKADDPDGVPYAFLSVLYRAPEKHGDD